MLFSICICFGSRICLLGDHLLDSCDPTVLFMGDNIKEKLAASHSEGAQGHMFLKKKPHTLYIDFLCFPYFLPCKNS